MIRAALSLSSTSITLRLHNILVCKLNMPVMLNDSCLSWGWLSLSLREELGMHDVVKGWHSASWGRTVVKFFFSQSSATDISASLDWVSKGWCGRLCMCRVMLLSRCFIVAMAALIAASSNWYGRGAVFPSKVVGYIIIVVLVLHLLSSWSRRLTMAAGESCRKFLVGISHRIVILGELGCWLLCMSNFEAFNPCRVGEGQEMVSNNLILGFSTSKQLEITL